PPDAAALAGRCHRPPPPAAETPPDYLAVHSASNGCDAAGVQPYFKKRPTCRGEIELTMPRRLASAASSLGVQCVTGRPESSGGSQASARICVTCSAENFGTAPGRGASERTSTTA